MVSFLPSGPRIMFSSIAPPQDFINLILYFSNFNGLTKKKKILLFSSAMILIYRFRDLIFFLSQKISQLLASIYLLSTVHLKYTYIYIHTHFILGFSQFL